LRSVGGREERGQVNQRFIVDDGGGEGGCTKSTKLVANFVVALDDEATFLALDCVFFVQSGCACERPAIHFKFLLGCSSTASEFLGVLKLVVIFRRKHKVKIAQWLCTILI